MEIKKKWSGVVLVIIIDIILFLYLFIWIISMQNNLKLLKIFLFCFFQTARCF